MNSIADQTYPNVEVVVVEGQSQDKTMDRILPFANQISQIISGPDQGLYDAINKGLARANGEIISILNGDDYYANSSVLESYAAKFTNEQVGIVFGDLEFFSPEKPTKTLRRYSSRKFNPERLRYGWMPPHPTTFVRRSVYDAVGQYRTDYEISADFEFLIRALWLHAVEFDRIASVSVRMQYGGLSTSGIIATYKLNNEIIRACRENGLKTSWPRILLKFPIKLLEFLPAFHSASERRAGAKTQT
jgi:glycosyltransferase involved in cell wall biosynthesis